MRLPGTGNQSRNDYLYVADAPIVAGGTAQLVLGKSISRSYLYLQNLDSGPMYIEFGSARATCTISGGAVNSVTITNAGRGYSSPPIVRFLGGGVGPPLPAQGLGPAGLPFLGGNQVNYPAPSHFATAHAVMTGSAPNQTVASIAIDDGGAGYLRAPFVFLDNSPLDPYGSAAPSSGSGMLLVPQGEPLVFNGTCCPTDAIAVWSSTTNAVLTCRWMD
jgi:hypothetical protein